MSATTNTLGTKMNFVSLLAFLLFALPGIILAADSPEATIAPVAICADCHGKDGASTQQDVPIIGGFSTLALEEDLFAFRDGVRPCRTTSYRAGVPDRTTTDMCRISADLSDDEIVQIAAFYAAKAFVPANEQRDSDNVTRGEKIHKELGCVQCHGKGGSDPADDAGILAGQWVNYLTTALIDFRTGKRWIPKNMETKFRNLTDQDIEALAHYYGSEGYRH